MAPDIIVETRGGTRHTVHALKPVFTALNSGNPSIRYVNTSDQNAIRELLPHSRSKLISVRSDEDGSVNCKQQELNSEKENVVLGVS